MERFGIVPRTLFCALIWFLVSASECLLADDDFPMEIFPTNLSPTFPSAESHQILIPTPSVPVVPTHPESTNFLDAHDSFKGRCVSCHTNMGSPLFGQDGFPKEASLDKVLNRIRLPLGANGHMPPSRVKQLSTEQKQSVENWVKDRKTQIAKSGKQDPSLCYGTHDADRISDLRATSLMKKHCGECHTPYDKPGNLHFYKGGLFMNGMKTQHLLFMNSDDGLNTAILGDPSEMQGRKVPKKWGTIEKILTALSDEFMPPRNMSSFLVPDMPDQDRADLLKWLNQEKQKQNCPIAKGFPLRQPVAGNPLRASMFSEAAKECSAKGGFIPTAKQMENYLKENKPEVSPECYWTFSFSGDTKLKRIILTGNTSKPEHYFASENYKCSTFCAMTP